MDKTYREQFVGDAKGENYDQDQYDPRSYSSLLWELEKTLLKNEVENLETTVAEISYLDFATGTGRILTYIEGRVDNAVGIEISEDMVEIAREKVAKAKIYCKDITPLDATVEGRYDLITTFRFVLNAEPALQVAGLKALAARMKDKNSLLIFNNHGNLYSLKLLLWPIHRIKQLGKPYLPKGNYMTNKRVEEIVHEAGLRLEKRIGYGLLTEKLSRIFSFEIALKIERLLLTIPGVRRFGVNQFYVAKLK